MKNPNRILLLFALSLIAFSSLAQVQPVYLFQKDDTLVKRHYLEQTLSKKQQVISSLGKEHANDYKKIYEQHFGSIGSFWKSNGIVTAPEAHDYLKAVVGHIIKSNPELKGIDARVVFSRDEWPNAFSMGDGSICVNAGLLLFLDNEAELVFTLCHELSHYYLKHSDKAIKSYVQTINSEAFKQEIKRLSKEEYRVNQQLEKLVKNVLFDKHKHSRENEAEADRQAFIFMRRTGYDLAAIRTTLDMLDKVDDSNWHQPVNPETVFNFANYPFKKRWVQKESAIFSQLDENDSPLSQKERDSLKTHPDCQKRIAWLSDSITRYPGGAKFLVNEATFHKLKKEFFPEVLEQYYRDEYLGRNLYLAMVMLEQQVNQPLAIYSIARCLNDIYDNQAAHTLGLKVGAESRFYPADYNQVLRMISKWRLQEVAEVNYHFCKKYQEEMKGYAGFDKEWRRVVNNYSKH
jgi:Zn-dependent protease with chaperone function